MIDKVLLFPYYLTLKVRNALYNHQFLVKSREAEVPTVCVGNVTVGGTGKTPHTEMILRMLMASDEWKNKNLAVLSRGYKRKSKGFQQVTTQRNASFFGDEPVQIKKKFPGVTVALDKNRIRGCRNLCHPDMVRTQRQNRGCLDKDFPAADLIILDDAFQYRKLKATLNVVLVDFSRPVNKDKLLPMGGLRDLPERLADADVLIITKCPNYMDDWERTVWAQSCGVRDYATSTCTGVSRKGKKQYVLFSTIHYCPPEPIYEECDPRYVYSPRMVLFTGIAQDTPLRTYLSDNYKIVEAFRFSDHHAFSDSDIRRITATAERWSTAALGTTEKDAQRIIASKKMPPAMRKRLFQIPITVDFLTPEERTIFNDVLLGAVARP